MKFTLACMALALSAGSASPAVRPQQPTRSAELFSGIEGRWRGTLSYLDYGSGERVELPARADVELLEGVGRILTRLAISDPGHEVPSVEVLGVDLEAAVATAWSFGSDDPNAFERTSYRIVRRSLETRDRWSVTLATTGTDGGREAEFRELREQRGDRLVSTREVRYVDEGPQAAWFVRNTIELERVTTAPEDLVGTWLVDLGNGATTELTVATAGADHLTGSFYGTRFEATRVRALPDRVHLAFVTSDGSGPYNSQAELLEDGTLRGTTHSVGRDFLSVWTARRQ